MFFDLLTKKLSKEEKLDFLEYLSFQIKSGMSFLKALSRYTENTNRKEHVLRYAESAISDIQMGKSPADALLENGFIEKLEYGIVKNSSSNEELYISLLSVININKNQIKNKNVLEGSIRSGVMTFAGIFLLIPLFKDDVAALYSSFGQLQGLTNSSGKAAVIELPFLIKYWWSSFIIIGFIAVCYQSAKYLFKYLYENHSDLYYRVFRNRLYIDLISVLKTFYQLQNSMSISNAYIALSNSAPNLYWGTLFNEINLNLKQGGKASEVFASQKGIIPLEVINCFIDADETGNSKLYIDKAIDYCESKDAVINAGIKEWAPTIINFFLFMIVGALVVAFVKDTLQNGLLDVMSKM